MPGSNIAGNTGHEPIGSATAVTADAKPPQAATNLKSFMAKKQCGPEGERAKGVWVGEVKR